MRAKRLILVLFFVLFYTLCAALYAQAEAIPPNELVQKAWEASGKNNLEKVIAITDQCSDVFDSNARRLNSQLNSFPASGQEKEYEPLNNAATCMFIRAEALMHNGKTKEAVALFQKIINKYKWSQAWDPRGWFWSVAEKSQASVDMLTGKVQKKRSGKSCEESSKDIAKAKTKKALKMLLIIQNTGSFRE